MNIEYKGYMDMKIFTRDMLENPYWKKYFVLDHPRKKIISCIS